MNLRLFLYEVTLLLRLPAIRVALILPAVLLIFAALHQQGKIEQQNQQINEVFEARQKERLAAAEDLAAVERGEKSYPSMWGDPRGYYTWRDSLVQYPEHDLAFIAMGQRDLHAPLTTVGLYKKAETAGRDIGNPTLSLSGTFDPAFVIIFLAPLLMIGFCQGLISRERESGTLPLLMAQRGDLRSLFLLKTVPRFALLCGVILIALLISLFTAGVNPFNHLTQTLWLVGFITTYMVFWFLAAVLLNLYARSSAAHALALAGLWVAVCILLPAAISSASQRLFPIPSQAEIVSTSREESRVKNQEAAKILDQYYQDHPELTVQEDDSEHKGFFDFYRSSITVGMKTEDAMKPTLDLFASQQRKQQRFEAALANFSPAALASAFLEDLAGSSSDQYNQYGDAIAGFSIEWRRWWQAKAFAGELVSSQDIDQMPAFQFQLDDQTASQTARLLVLVIINLIILALIAWRLRGRAAYDLL